jgi:hypothetical protein
MLDEGMVLKIGFSIESEYEPCMIEEHNVWQCKCYEFNNC